MDVPGKTSADAAQEALVSASKIPANNDETNPAAMLILAEAQVHATLAVWEALADVAAELSIIRRQREG